MSKIMIKHDGFLSGITEFFLDNQLIMMCSCLALVLALAIGHTKYMKKIARAAQPPAAKILAHFVEHTSVPKGVIPVKAVVVVSQFSYVKTFN